MGASEKEREDVIVGHRCPSTDSPTIQLIQVLVMLVMLVMNRKKGKVLTTPKFLGVVLVFGFLV
jgi:hypothetical protein